MNIQPDYIFESSWEICNKIGGIYTVISTKAKSIVDIFGDNYILIGPDVWKETRENPDFIEDVNLFADWKAASSKELFKVRTGRWNIEGKPLVILVDFTPFYEIRDKVFAKFWESFKLDSLHGEWDYIESAMFGYAAGKVIHSFTKFYVNEKDNVIGHFHEWMTGAGVLYLNDNAPEISTVFTTHATALGRSVAGNGYPLYENISQYDPDRIARDFNLTSKHSLESKAAQYADVFTTVSEITAKECKQFLGIEPHVITTNGFEKGFVPQTEDFQSKKNIARQKALAIATEKTGVVYDEDTVLILTSGRYEYTNKGIDLYIKALSKFRSSDKPASRIVAYIAVPGAHGAPIQNNESKYLTHTLKNEHYDPVMNLIKSEGFTNDIDNNVHIIFVPVYLNGKDGVVNLPYYDFLIGFEYTIFPSYYEPWGYTPLESVAFKIPTITTNYAGFGDWVNNSFDLKYNSVSVITRNEGKSEMAIKQIQEAIASFLKSDNRDDISNETEEVLEKALWKHMKDKYLKAWELALVKSEARKEEIPTREYTETRKIDAVMTSNKPSWKKILVKNYLPKELLPLKEIAFNLWWSWNYKADDMFRMINPEKWEKFEFNPVTLIESLSKDEIDRLVANTEFIGKLHSVYADFKAYMAEAEDKPKELVAYTSMEYGLHNSLKIFSGGLGILAGDYLKQASDSNKNMVAVGLLYRYGYFNQELSIFGDQQAKYDAQKFTQLPIEPVRDSSGEWHIVKVALPGRVISAKVWRVNVGRIPLYLLDTDIAVNSEEDRYLTAQLYGGNNEHRLKQEIILGIGGVRMLNKLGIQPDVFHSNEGHSAFSGLERIRKIIKHEHVDFLVARELVRANTLFTTHTPVPAGHDVFEEHLVRAYLSHYCDIFGVDWNEFMALGRTHINNTDEKFSMSILAANLSQEINGVSRIHGRVSREMFAGLYPGYYPEELHVGYVTNGVHYFTWTDKIWQKLYHESFDEGFEHKQSDESVWEKILDVPDELIWKNRIELKKILIDKIKIKTKKDLTKRQESPAVIINSVSKIKADALIVGFARRFATYKRAHLLFTNLDRLSKIINNKEKPVIFIFSGKAHPHDKAGQDLIKRIVEVSKMPEFMGKILFLENYDMNSGKMLTSSVDIWLNTPTRPLEASGTSGEKAVMNGVANFSVLDGWWAEGYKPEAGWAIEEAKTFANQKYQDELDAQIIYNTFENEIVEKYYNRNSEGVSNEWISVIKNTIAKVAPHFTMQRMIEDYYNQYYSSLVHRRDQMYADSFKNSRELVEWKKKMTDSWENISIMSLVIPDADKKPITFGKLFSAEILLQIPGLVPSDLGAEIVMGNKTNGNIDKVTFKRELEIVDSPEGTVKFRCEFPFENTGVFDYAFRIFPNNKLLKYRMDFPLVKWI